VETVARRGGVGADRSDRDRPDWDRVRFPPLGRLVDVGGHRLHLLCIGSGSPLVLFEGSGFGNSTSAAVARMSLARHTRVCSYDRMSVGWSDAAPAFVSVGMLADDLLRLMDASLSPEPMILVARLVGDMDEGIVTGLTEAHQHLAQSSERGIWKVVPGSAIT
jgi:hypothetical protein